MPRPSSQEKHRRRRKWAATLTGIIVLTILASILASTATATSVSTQAGNPTDPSVAMYAADYSVSLQEAERRLDRIQPIQQILAQIRSLEQTRVAGWGIDHQGTFMGWVWLTGDAAPSAAATQIAAGHTDVEIRTSAQQLRAP